MSKATVAGFISAFLFCILVGGGIFWALRNPILVGGGIFWALRNPPSSQPPPAKKSHLKRKLAFTTDPQRRVI